VSVKYTIIVEAKIQNQKKKKKGKEIFYEKILLVKDYDQKQEKNIILSFFSNPFLVHEF